ncbi:MAG: hypothetical protein ACM33B_15980 [Pseudomonadota bacterium]
MRRRRFFALVLLTLAVVAAGCARSIGDEARAQPLRVLFVGNSLTATNDLPAAVAAIAERVGGRPFEVRAVVPGGVDLQDQWEWTGARDVLDGERWDVVVLQQGPSALPESQAHLRLWTQRWAAAIRARGARPALLQVWPEGDRPEALPAVLRSYAAAASAADATLLPAGAAWREAWRRDPALPLYGPDRFHPSLLGTALAALVVHAALTGLPPATLPGLAPATARLLREAARTALVER